MSNLASVTDNDFQSEVLNRDGLTMVDFWAPWCGPCRMLSPTLEAVQSEKGSNIRIVKLNIDDNPNIAAQYRVMSIPMMILFKDGQKVDQLMGNQPKAKIESMINKHI